MRLVSFRNGDEVQVGSLEDDRVRDLSFQCSCCGISMASASVMTTLTMPPLMA